MTGPAVSEGDDDRETLARTIMAANGYRYRDIPNKWLETADAILAAGFRRPADTAPEAALHVMRWTFEDGGTRAEAVCLAEPGADCRLMSAGPECDCEYWGRIERRDDGTIWHVLADGYRDLTLPRDEDEWHQVIPQDECNVCLSINESGCAEELTPEDDQHTEFVLAEVPFEPVWENDGCSWRPILARPAPASAATTTETVEFEWGVQRTLGAVGTVANFEGSRRSAEKAAHDWLGVLVQRTVTRSEWTEVES